MFKSGCFWCFGNFTSVVKMGVCWGVSKFLNINPDQVTPHLKVLHKKIVTVFEVFMSAMSKYQPVKVNQLSKFGRLRLTLTAANFPKSSLSQKNQFCFFNKVLF